MNQIEKIERLAAKHTAPRAKNSWASVFWGSVALAVMIGSFAAMFPRVAHAQESSVLATLESYEKVLLQYEQGVTRYEQGIVQQQQQVIAPTAQIQSTQGWMATAQPQYNSYFGSVNALPLNSATTPQVTAFQNSLQSGGSSSSVQSNYVQVYGAKPSSTSVSTTVASRVDAADTSANEALTLANTSDVVSGNLVNSANMLEASASSAQPGVAQMIEAQSQVMQLHSNSVMHHLLAAMLRQQAQRLASQGAAVKAAAAAHSTALSSFGIGGQ